MGITGKVLAQGYIPSPKGTIYTSASGSRTYIKFFSLYNDSAVSESAQNVKIFVSSSLSVVIGRVQLLPSESALVIDKDEALILTTGDKIEASTNNTGSIQYTIIGGIE